MFTPVSRRACLWAVVGLTAGLGCDNTKPSKYGQARRIVSLSPSTTETLFALGAGDRLVGRSRYCNHPPEVVRIRVVGGYVDHSMEAILALTPDLVVGARGPSGRGLVDKLRARGIACYFPPTESIDEIMVMILGMADRLQVRAAGDKLVRSIRQRLEAVERAVAGKPRPRTLLVYGQSPIVVAGTGTFPAEMLAMAGCENAASASAGYPALGMETVLGLDPDLVIDATMAGGRSNAPSGTSRAGWANLRAVKDGRIVRLADDRAMRPGPRVAEGVEQLARAAHPEVHIP